MNLPLTSWRRLCMCEHARPIKSIADLDTVNMTSTALAKRSRKFPKGKRDRDITGIALHLSGGGPGASEPDLPRQSFFMKLSRACVESLKKVFGGSRAYETFAKLPRPRVEGLCRKSSLEELETERVSGSCNVKAIFGLIFSCFFRLGDGRLHIDCSDPSCCRIYPHFSEIFLARLRNVERPDQHPVFFLELSTLDRAML